MADARKATAACTTGTGDPKRRSRTTQRRGQSANRRGTQEQTPSAAATDAVAIAPGKSVRSSKKSAVIALLQRPEGAAIEDLIAATGWQPHSVRAALTGLRKEGKELARAKDAAGVTHYRLAAEG